MRVAYVTGIEFHGRKCGDTYPLAESILQTLMHRRAGFIFCPKSQEEVAVLYLSLINTYKAEAKSTIAVPLISHNKVIGSLGFVLKKPNAYTPADLNLAERIGNQIAGAIANAQIKA